MKTHNYFVYLVTNFNKSVLYVGVTSNLTRRITEHANGLTDGFSKKYHSKYLVYYQHFSYIDQAISREKQIKKWSRKKKNELIKKFNPDWKFLNNSLASIEQAYS